jgi:hydrogenase maturation protein HypF
VFVGSVRTGFDRIAHLRETGLAGGDAAARFPVQSATGFLEGLDDATDFMAPPFCFPPRYLDVRAVQKSGLRMFRTTSAGRLFDAVAALCGFVAPITFEGQAAMWLEHLARNGRDDGLQLPLTYDGSVLDWRETLLSIVRERRHGTRPEAIARAFHRALATGIARAVRQVAAVMGLDVVVASGGVVQNVLLLDDLMAALSGSGVEVWTNRIVPPNDGGLSLGQAALTLQARSA